MALCGKLLTSADNSVVFVIAFCALFDKPFSHPVNEAVNRYIRDVGNLQTSKSLKLTPA
jgi:hypothetical protein